MAEFQKCYADPLVGAFVEVGKVIITGHTPGHMIDTYGPKREHKRYAKNFQECPSCGGQMHKTAELCHNCHVEHNNTFGSIDDPKAPDRRERFDLALAAGWALVDLLELARLDKLPTREQIAARKIENRRILCLGCL